MKILTSNTSHGAFKAIVQEINNNLEDDKTNGVRFPEHVVLAPDRFTAFVERALLKELGKKSTFGIEVASFIRLANNVLSGTKEGKQRKCLTPEGSVMLVEEAILSVEKELKYFRNVAKKDGFASELYASLTALRNGEAKLEEDEAPLRQAAKLGEKAKQVADATLKKKLEDIALIYGKYLELLVERGRNDSTTRLEEFADYLLHHPEELAGKHFYCTDIYEFSEPEIEILRCINDNETATLTIALTSGKGYANSRIYPDNLIDSLKSKIDLQCELVAQPEDKLDAPFDCISKHLFAYKAPSPVKCEDKVAIRVANNRYDEVLALVVDILSKVRNGGRYKDIEVYASDLQSYQAELKSAFVRYDIPFFIDQKEKLIEQAKTRYLLSALAVVSSNFRMGEVLDFVKNPLFIAGLDTNEDAAREKAYLFENYVLKYNVTYIPNKEFEFGKLHEDDEYYHGANFKGSAVDKAVQVVLNAEEKNVPNEVRQKLFEVLTGFTSLKDASVKDIVVACKGLLGGVDKAWTHHVDKLAEIDKSGYYQKCAEQVNQKIDRALDEIKEVLGNSKKDIGDFERIFRAMIESVQIALVPTLLDSVFVGTSGSRFMGLGDVYVLGAIEGSLPAQAEGRTCLTTSDEDKLQKENISIQPTTKQRNMTAKYEVCDLMKKPRGRLVVSYPEVVDGSAKKKAAVVDELKNMFLRSDGKPLEIERISFERLKDEQREIIGDLFATKRASYHEVLRHTASADANETDLATVFSSALQTLDANQRAVIVGISVGKSAEDVDNWQGVAPLEKISVSRIEKFYSCPYEYFFQYVLYIKERIEGELMSNDSGTILHAVFELFLKDVRDGKIDTSKVTDAELEKKAEEYFDAVMNDFDYLKGNPQIEDLKKESIVRVREFKDLLERSEFKPILLEAKIGKEKEGEDHVGKFTIKVKMPDGTDKDLPVDGYIDRIDARDAHIQVNGEDTTQHQFIVVDYKSYKSADITLGEIYSGQKVQLLIYMKAYEDNHKGAVPVGVFYLPIYESVQKEVAPKYRYKGFAFNNSNVLNAIDSETDNNKSIVRRQTSARKINALIADDTGLDTLGDFAVDVVAKGVEAINSGYIKPLHVDDCDNCKYKYICAHSGDDTKRKVKSVKWENLGVDPNTQ